MLGTVEPQPIIVVGAMEPPSLKVLETVELLPAIVIGTFKPPEILVVAVVVLELVDHLRLVFVLWTDVVCISYTCPLDINPSP